jgi:hypothetical protein
MTLTTCLRGMSQNLSFLRLWPFSWSIAHSFGVPGRFTWPMTLSTCLRGMTKTLRFCVSGRFMSDWPQSWVSGVIYKSPDTQYIFGRHDQKLVIFAFMDIFLSYCPLFWGSRAI